MDKSPRNEPPQWYRWYRAAGISAAALSVFALLIGIVSLMQVFWITAALAMTNIGVINWVGDRR